LDLLHEAGGAQTVYLPLLGTGAGRLSPVKSAEVMVAVLGEQRPATIQHVWLSAPDAEAAEAIAANWSADVGSRDRLSLSRGDVEPHVGQALVAARTLAGTEAVAPSHVLRAVASLGSVASSPAFEAFRKLLKLEPDEALKASLAQIGGAELDIPLTHDFRRQLEYVQRTNRTKGSRTLWGRDLVTAALLAGGDDLHSLFQTSGVTLGAIRDRWYDFVAYDDLTRPPQEWDLWWDFAGVPRPGHPGQAGYAADSDQGVDHLGIDQEAAAFARLILDENVDPPLSIGLLGDWGSGKSFFIEELKRQIDALRGGPGLLRDVVPIEFNAWHVSDSNLWASLVTHIFDEIWKRASAPGKPEEARQQLVAEIEKVEGAIHHAESQVQMAKAAVDEAEKTRAAKLDALALRTVIKRRVLERLQEKAKQAGWQRPLDNLIELESTARELGESGQRLRAQFDLVLGERLGRFVLPFLVVIATAAGTWLLIEYLPVAGHVEKSLKSLAQQLTEIIGVVGAAAASVLMPLRSAKRRLDAFVAAVAATRAHYDRGKKSGKFEQAEAARRDLETTEKSLAAARTRLADLLNQQAALDPAKRLYAFLEERVLSSQYRSQQGIISLVHRDFQQLSDRMKAWRLERQKQQRMQQKQTSPPQAPDTAEGSASARINIDRIVLYIDDLDRCRPEHVVSALEAVHLLLALDLFVVVVAVDSRWLIRALEAHYREMLTSGRTGRGSTAQDYLEKIFQITYALAPMDDTKFADYVDDLTATQGPAMAAPNGALVASDGAHLGGTTSLTASARGSSNGGSAARAVQSPPKESAAAGSTPLVPPRPRPSALPPVTFGDAEKRFLKKLASLLATPRMAKRLVNVYRLIKASHPELVATEEHQQAALLLLATLFGQPNVGAQLLRDLHEKTAPFDQSTTSLSSAIERYAQSGEGAADGGRRDGWKTYARRIDALDLGLTIRDCAGLPAVLARYSFVTGHEWHTWTAARRPRPTDLVKQPAPAHASAE
jgi:hypothetical protein